MIMCGKSQESLHSFLASRKNGESKQDAILTRSSGMQDVLMGIECGSLF